MTDLKGAALSRILGILDEGSFIEIGASITGRKDAGCGSALLNGDGVITGYGTVNDRLCFIYSQNPDVKGGSIGEMHAKKVSNIYSMALKMGAPVIAVMDCAGVRVEEGNDSLWSFGKIFKHQAKANGVIPQITAVYGTCGGGMAVSAALSDFVFMEKDAKLFVQSPDAVTGNFTGKCDTASASFQAEETGNCVMYGTDDEIAKSIRELLAILPQNNEEDLNEEECDDDLNRSVEGVEKLQASEILSEIADNGKFFELKKDYVPCIVTGFLKMNGRTIGAIANNKDEMCAEGVWKASYFLRFCDAFNIPVLTLANVKGFTKDMANEKKIAGAVSDFTYSFASMTVPSVTVVTGNAYGTAGLVMGSKAIGADLAFAFKNAKMGLMPKEELDKLTDLNKEKDVYSALYNAERGYVDDIIEPAELRQRVAAAFEMLSSKVEEAVPKKHGTK